MNLFIKILWIDLIIFKKLLIMIFLILKYYYKFIYLIVVLIIWLNISQIKDLNMDYY